MKYYAVANRYSKALWALSANTETAAQWLKNLTDLSSSVEASSDLQLLLKSPVFSFETKWAVLSVILKQMEAAPLVQSFIHKTLSAHRMGALSHIVEAFRSKVLHDQGIAEVIVESPQPLSAAEESEIRTRFEKITKKKVLLVCKSAPQLLAGIRAQCEGRTFDGSLQTLLNNMQKHLLKEDLGSHATA